MIGWFEERPSFFKAYYCYTSEDPTYAPGSSFANMKYPKHFVALKIFVNIKRKICDVLDPNACEYEDARDIEYVFLETSQPLIFRIMRDYTTTAYKYERCDATNDEYLILKDIIKDVYMKDPDDKVSVKAVVFNDLYLNELYTTTKRFLNYYNNKILNVVYS
jgi:hypothetical protein